jgi:hypothetical protein
MNEIVQVLLTGKHLFARGCVGVAGLTVPCFDCISDAVSVCGAAQLLVWSPSVTQQLSSSWETLGYVSEAVLGDMNA